MSHELENQSVEEMLTNWGLRCSGGRMAEPKPDGLEKRGASKDQLDDYMALVAYVEKTKGFDRASPVLRHLYVLCEPIESYRYVLPGETMFLAAWRHEQLSEYGSGVDAIPLASKLHIEFRRALSEKMAKSPFRVPVRVIELSPQDIADQVSGDVDMKAARYGRGRR